jgi:mannose-1-phosphate guanylyltransferase
MRAVVLVGGFGTRLRPLTNDVPKPMLPIGHEPMIARLVGRLARAGVDDVVLALGFRPEPFMAAFPDGTCGDAALHYAVEPEPLDTGGAIRFAAEHGAISDTFVVANGDIVTDLDVAALVAAHRASGAEATIHLTPVDDPSSYGVVDLAPDGRVRRFVEKPAPGSAPSNLINAGTYVFEPSVIARIPTGRKVSIERETFPELVGAGTLRGVATDDYWIDAGRPDTYRAANLDLLDDRDGHGCPPVSDDADVDATAEIQNSVVGAGCSVGPRARIVDTVLLPGASVGADSVVERSLVMGTVGDHAVLLDVVVGRSGHVDAGARVSDTTVPAPD